MGLYSYTRAMFVIQNFEPGANIFGPEWPISPSLHALAETTFYAFKACVLPPFHAVGQDQADGQACLFSVALGLPTFHSWRFVPYLIPCKIPCKTKAANFLRLVALGLFKASFIIYQVRMLLPNHSSGEMSTKYYTHRHYSPAARQEP